MNRTLTSLLLMAAVASAQSPYRLAEWVIDEGGRTATAVSGGRYIQHGSFHQSTIGKTTSDGNYVAWVGYWHPRPYFRDVAVVQILSPVRVADTLFPVTPSATVANYGDLREVFKVWFRVTRTNGTLLYLDSTTLGLNPHEQWMAVFRLCSLHVTGPCIARCSTALAADMDNSNDVKFVPFKSLGRPQWPEGWHDAASMLKAPTPRGVSDGGWLTYSAGNSRFYAFKGGYARLLLLRPAAGPLEDPTAGPAGS